MFKVGDMVQLSEVSKGEAGYFLRHIKPPFEVIAVNDVFVHIKGDIMSWYAWRFELVPDVYTFRTKDYHKKDVTKVVRDPIMERIDSKTGAPTDGHAPAQSPPPKLPPNPALIRAISMMDRRSDGRPQEYEHYEMQENRGRK